MVQVKVIQSNSIMSLEKDINSSLEKLGDSGYKDEELSVQYNLYPNGSLLNATAMIVCKNFKGKGIS